MIPLDIQKQKDYYTAGEAAQYLAQKWGIESYSTTAFRLLRWRWDLQPDMHLGNASLWKQETLDTIPKPDRSKPRLKKGKRSPMRLTPPKYEWLLGMIWELYYTSTIQKAAASIEENLQTLVAAAESTSGVRKDQYEAMLCRFYQVSSLVARDQMQFARSVEDEHKAVEIAFRLKNAELIASSLLRRARIYIQQEDYVLAYQDAMQMLPYADLSRDPLKGKCYQMAGEATGYIAVNDSILQKKSMDYFHKALRIVQKADMTPDGSFVRTDVTSILIEKADALILFGRIADAHDALAIAREHLSPEQNRWRINLLLSEARAYLAEKDVASCCVVLIEATSIIRAISLSAKEDRVLALLKECQQLAPQDSEVQRLETLFSSKTV